MKVSIIIPIYNAEKYIKKCLNSVINQTYKNIEILFVDDGSKDKSLEIVKKVEDKRIKTIVQQNKGAYLARKTGYEKSQGDYITFIDADDWIDDDYIEILVKKAEETCADIVRMSYTKNFVEQNRYKKENFPYAEDHLIIKKNFYNELYSKLINTYFYNSMCCQLINKKIIKFNDNSNNIVMGEDLLFNLSLIDNAKKIYVLNENKYHYRYNSGSVTTNIDKNFIIKKSEDIIRVYLRLKQYGIKWNFDALKIQQCEERIIKEYITQMNYLFLNKKIIKNYSQFNLLFNNNDVNNLVKNLKNKKIIDTDVKKYIQNPRYYYYYYKYIMNFIFKIKSILKKLLVVMNK